MKPESLLKFLIWLYLALLIFEGALRKWVLPGMSDALLIVRDPIVILIYLLALGQGRLPLNGWTFATIALAGAAFVGALLAGQDNLLITFYGIRTNFLHVPLIWVMAAVLTRRDVENLGRVILLLAIPMTLLMVVQFKSSPTAYINRGVGDSEEGMGQLYGAMGHIRPPGFFSFITGPQLFYPLALAFLCHQFTAKRRLFWPILAACGAAILIAVPISISRTLAVATIFIVAVFVPAMAVTGRLRSDLLRTGAIVAVALLVVSFLPVFDDAREAFLSRWETAQAGQETQEGVGLGSIFDRLFGGWDYLYSVLSTAPLFGSGIGMGSNVAARLATGRLGFLLAENEWAKCLLELGPLLGLAFLGYRLMLAAALLRRSLRRLFIDRDLLPLLILCACASAIVFGQWAPPTILGFAVFGSGLCLAACQDEPEEETEEEEDDAFEADDEATTGDESEERQSESAP
ncbi:MAG TPA: hypothetical protein VK163_14920 [Opitutaceae bacterium]|nr:hypothetical protein [Opitutaceae bacterium]